jgi:hypothetical protein
MLELAEVVQNLRSELYDAMATSVGETLQFEVGDVQLELSIAVTKEGGVSGKIRFYVVELGGEGTLGESSTQKLTLNLTPRLITTGRAPVVSGDTVNGESAGPT